MQVRWSPRASSDFDSLFTYIAADSDSAAIRQARFVLTATRQLELFPQSGRRTGIQHVRELVVPSTPFLIRYSLDKDAINILSITHGARDESMRV